MSKELKELFRQVEADLNPEISKAARPTKLRAPRKGKANSRDRENFMKMCRARAKSKAKIQELQKNINDTEDRLTSFVLRHGVMVREQDRAFYTHPYKAQVETIRNTGSLDTDTLRAFEQKKNLGLFDQEVRKTVDLIKVQGYVESAMLAPKVKEDLLDAVRLIEEIARNQKVNAVEESVDEFLNIERYDEAKEKGLIPERVIQKVEANLKTRNRLSVDEITGEARERCPGCSQKKPKKRSEELYTCIRCGAES